MCRGAVPKCDCRKQGFRAGAESRIKFGSKAIGSETRVQATNLTLEGAGRGVGRGLFSDEKNQGKELF